MLLSSINVFSQSNKVDSSAEKNKYASVRLKTRALKDRILLRWAVDKPIEWKRTNEAGFKIERLTIVRDSNVLRKSEKITLFQILKPKPLIEWQEIAMRNDKAAVIAQSLYGESFGTTESKTGIGKSLDKMEELNQRFMFALMSADQSFEAACFAGWGFTDSTVKANEKYLYRVIPLAQNIRIDTANAYTRISDFLELPKPFGLLANFGNKKVEISWDYETYQNLYNAFYVERSEDSVNFKNITQVPVLTLNTSEEPLTRMNYTDSLAENDKVYYYRVKGVTCFGEISPPSKQIIRGFGFQSLQFAPNFDNSSIVNDSTVNLEWVYSEDTSAIFDHFEIGQSDQNEGVYKIVNPRINRGERKATVVGLMPSNYFVVSAVDKYGYKKSGFPLLVQPVDSTPPAIPTGLVATVNDSGKVILKWNANKETDLQGYNVFKANTKSEEMSLVTKEPITSLDFLDSVNLKMGNPTVFYTLVALDKRFNQSKPCAIVELTKPDKIPPTSPSFIKYKLAEDKVFLQWANSNSEDVAVHRIYKRNLANAQSDNWELIKEFAGRDSTTFADTAVIPGTKISYTIIAVDKSKNESPPAMPLTVDVPLNKKNKQPVKELKAEPDRPNKKITIGWKYEEQGVVEYQLYKTQGKIPYTLWKVLDNQKLSIVDNNVTASNLYKYAVRAVFKDGTMSNWSEVQITF